MIPIRYFLSSPSKQFDLGYDPKIELLLNKIIDKAIKLGQIADTKDGIIQSKIPDKLFLKEPKNKNSKKLLFGKNITRYNIEFDSNWVNYSPKEMMEIELGRGGGGLRLRVKEIFERNKILTRQTADEIIAAFDDKKYYYSNTLHGTMVTDQDFDPYYVLAILNSKLTTWYYRATTAERGKVFAQIKIDLLKKIPILKISKESQKYFIDLVKRIYGITKEDDYLKNFTKQAEIEGLQAQINKKIYELYGLTREEIEMVEGKKDAEAEYLKFMAFFKKQKTKKAKLKLINSKTEEDLDLIFEGLDKFREGQAISGKTDELANEFIRLLSESPPRPQAKHSA